MKTTRFKKQGWLWLACAAGYPAVLCLLTLAERSDPNATIQTFEDALWYSLITISTVGYGDLYPVTTAGRLLSMVFILLSLGLFTFLIGLLIRIVTGSVFPAIRLWLARKKTWYIFSCRSSAAFALAKNLAEQEPDCILLFPQGTEPMLPEQFRSITYTGSPQTLAARKKDHCHICFMEDAAAYERATSALQTGHPVYCRTEFAPDICPDNLTLFHPYDCCARRYWQDHGLKGEERTVLLIGDGKYAEALLTRGLLLNVYGTDRTVTYHVFGDWENYRRSHYRMAQTLCLEGENPDMDRPYFHEGCWNGDSALLAEADRIILCREDRNENLDILGQLHRYFPVRGSIHLLSDSPVPGVTVFGTQDTVYTPQLVFQEQLNQAARALHGIYSESSGGNGPGWAQLSEFQRQSNIAAADHLLTKLRILLEDDTIDAVTPERCRAAYDRYRSCTPEQREVFRRIEHLRWMRFHSLYNWSYCPVRNNGARQHPAMVPYEDLTPAEQAKDDFPWELLGKIAEKIENK